jgi:hypothetical protein
MCCCARISLLWCVTISEASFLIEEDAAGFPMVKPVVREALDISDSLYRMTVVRCYDELPFKCVGPRECHSTFKVLPPWVWLEYCHHVDGSRVVPPFQTGHGEVGAALRVRHHALLSVDVVWLCALYRIATCRVRSSRLTGKTSVLRHYQLYLTIFRTLQSSVGRQHSEHLPGHGVRLGWAEDDCLWVECFLAAQQEPHGSHPT